MNFRKLKNIAAKLGGVLVLDNGEPSFVILSYDKFKNLDANTDLGVDIFSASAGNGEANGWDEEHNEIERLNQEILTLKEEIRQKEAAELALSENGVDESPIEPLVF